MKKRPAIPRLDGGPQTILLVEDVERSAAFYRESLLLAQKDGDPGRYVEFDPGDGGTLLLVKREGTIAPMAAAVAASAKATLTFAIPTEGYETWKKWLAKRGVPVEHETRWVHGGRSLYVRDPDGWRLEFKTPPVLSPPPPSPPKPRDET